MDPKPMDPKIYIAVMNDKPNALKKKYSLPDQITHGLTPNENTVLHVAAEFGSYKCVKDILSNCPTPTHLLCQKNKNGDTPLHSAFAGRRNNAQKFLDSFFASAKSLDGGETAVREMLRARNNEGDTPLHLAARRSSTSSAADTLKWLFKRDPEQLDHGPNKAEETPLYLYVERGSAVEVLSEMLKTCTKLEYGGPSGRTALHAAVIHRKVKFLDELIQWKKDLIKEADANGRTPLHYAAEDGNVEAVKKLLAKDESVAYVTVKKPLPKDESVAYVTVKKPLPKDESGPANNDKGNTTLHVAATAKGDTKASTAANSDEGITALHGAPAKGDTKASSAFSDEGNTALHGAPAKASTTANSDEGNTALHLATAIGDTKVMKELLTKCPDCWEMVNSKGQNILHISVDSERHEATRYISKQPWVWCLVNRKDHDGNTPMHLIAHKGKRNSLFLSHMKTLMKNVASTSDKLLPKFPCNHWLLQNKFLGGSDEKGQGGKEEKEGQKSEVQMILNTFNRENKRQKAGEDMTKMTETHMLVATLISTITFAAGFTLPGGYEDQDPNEGMAVLVREAAFKAFVITNTIALICSTSSVFLYVSASLFKNAGRGEEKRAHRYEIAFWLILVAMLAMMVAFGTGAYAVLANSSGLAIATCAVACSSFIVYAIELTKHFPGEIAYVMDSLAAKLVVAVIVLVAAIVVVKKFSFMLVPLVCLCIVCCLFVCLVRRIGRCKKKKASLDDEPSQSSSSQV